MHRGRVCEREREDGTKKKKPPSAPGAKSGSATTVYPFFVSHFYRVVIVFGVGRHRSQIEIFLVGILSPSVSSSTLYISVLIKQPRWFNNGTRS